MKFSSALHAPVLSPLLAAQTPLLFFDIGYNGSISCFLAKVEPTSEFSFVTRVPDRSLLAEHVRIFGEASFRVEWQTGYWGKAKAKMNFCEKQEDAHNRDMVLMKGIINAWEQPSLELPLVAFIT